MVKTEEEIKEEVTKVVNGDEAEPSTVEQPEDVTSQEVKTEPEEEIEEEVEETTEEPEGKVEEVEEEPITEEPPKVEEETKLTKLETQVSNLNTAIKDEREGKRENFEKISALEKSLEEKNNLIDELKSNPTEPAEGYEGLTAQQVEEIFERKTEERRKEESTAKLAADTKLEIQTLAKEYDGKDGKPLYDDTEVFKWQQTNQKLYLSPKEAFNVMKQNELVDYEVKQRLAGKKVTRKVEKPSAVKEVHEPVAKKDGPVNDNDMGKMVSEAINDVEREI